MKTNKKIMFIVIAIISVCLLFGVGTKLFMMYQTNEFKKSFGYRIQNDKIIKNFKNNNEYFNKIALYIVNYKKQSNEDIYITKSKNNYILEFSSKNIQKHSIINDVEVDKCIKYIFLNYHFTSIVEDKGNGIYFTTDDTNFGFEHGVVFTKNNKVPDGWGIPVDRTEKIIDNWYYYEAS